ncbi:hypothetical protein AMQ84_27220 [Paenibacillus riograndensis]|uniref:Uncharacterized protein n=1 Tax=Paenibacillus riograndensis TaxID=483937 RepID=A0A132TJU5_9BACL|nr:hypothetical protein [Paenibacillus riograndensis]KWX71615.1 hypothetical protein AMQ84_27220 [Paenibacillus riograndensis]
MLINSNTHMSHEMSAQEETMWMHFFTRNGMFTDFVENQRKWGENPFSRVGAQPICPKCEKPGFHHHGGMVCVSCGHTGAVELKTREYLKDGWWK